jgi:transposase-like protein
MPESLKTRIVGEVLRGEISLRAASTKYNIHRRTIRTALQKVQVNGLVNDAPVRLGKGVNLDMNEKQLERTSAQQIKALTEELKKARLKIEGLDIMINEAEEKFKIKIRKKAGTKQSRDCGSDTRK